jgi:hypothetical protein
MKEGMSWQRDTACRGIGAGSSLLQSALYTEEVRSARPQNILSARAIAMTIVSGPNSRLRKRPML